jgi:hypothetical protein
MNVVRRVALWFFWALWFVMATILGVRNNPGALGSSNPRSLNYSQEHPHKSRPPCAEQALGDL